VFLAISIFGDKGAKNLDSTTKESTMNNDLLVLFFHTLICFAAVLLPLFYLRPITRKVIERLCGDADVSVDFWMRLTTVQALVGSLLLVMFFADMKGDNFLYSLRLTLALSLMGVFVTTMLLSNEVRRAGRVQMARSANAAVTQDSSVPNPWTGRA
jgi:hypothetical protein